LSDRIDKLESNIDESHANLIATEIVKLCEKGITNEIKKYIKENLVYSAPELYKQIILEKLNGYELFTVDQAYYWWAYHAVTKY
ncbi:16773_t:CDS:2, partial [Racocetra persica]